MLEISNYLHNASLLLVALAMLANLAALAQRIRARRVETARALVPAGDGSPDEVAAPLGLDEDDLPSATGRRMEWYGDSFAQLAFVTITLSLLFRSLVTGHAPFANQFEFAIAFVWAVLGMYAWFEWKYQIRGLALLVMPFAFAMLLYSFTLDSEISPLVPALQNSWLLTVHVFAAVIAYGAAAVSVAAAAFYLVRPRLPWRGLPSEEVLEEIGYKAVVLAFPMLTIMLVLGALWADIAWGRYWSWDPKETAALVTWLIYGAYLHARVVAGWRGRKAAWLLVLGFVAVIFTFTGNHWFGGLHSYV